jgi:hypothetical protein
MDDTHNVMAVQVKYVTQVKNCINPNIGNASSTIRVYSIPPTVSSCTSKVSEANHAPTAARNKTKWRLIEQAKQQYATLAFPPSPTRSITIAFLGIGTCGVRSLKILGILIVEIERIMNIK